MMHTSIPDLPPMGEYAHLVSLEYQVLLLRVPSTWWSMEWQSAGERYWNTKFNDVLYVVVHIVSLRLF